MELRLSGVQPSTLQRVEIKPWVETLLFASLCAPEPTGRELFHRPCPAAGMTQTPGFSPRIFSSAMLLFLGCASLPLPPLIIFFLLVSNINLDSSCSIFQIQSPCSNLNLEMPPSF